MIDDLDKKAISNAIINAVNNISNAVDFNNAIKNISNAVDEHDLLILCILLDLRESIRSLYLHEKRNFSLVIQIVEIDDTLSISIHTDKGKASINIPV